MALAQSHMDTCSLFFTHVTGEHFISSLKGPQYNIPLIEANRLLMGISRSKQKPQCRVSRHPTLRQKETASERKIIFTTKYTGPKTMKQFLIPEHARRHHNVEARTKLGYNPTMLPRSYIKIYLYPSERRA